MGDVTDSDLNIMSRLIHDLSNMVGFSEHTLKFFISVLICYPLALIPKYLYSAPANVQHIIYILIGFAISYFNFGNDTVHYVITIAVNYVLLTTVGGSRTSVLLSFIFNMAYFVIGTYSVSDGSHDVFWDTPHCVMVLKMIGVAFDLYDGQKDKESLSQEQKMFFLIRAPTLLEISGFSMFFGGFLAGPQFSMRLYLNYTNENLIPEWERKNPSNVLPSIKVFLFGIIYICVGTVLNTLFPNSYLLSDDFKDSSLIYQLFRVYMFGHSFMTKFVGIWLFTEAICILSGISYNGLDSEGSTKWNGMENAKIKDLETAITFRDLVASYNINTNKWAGRCIYKRCKFLGNRQLSQFITLMFLALWHGIYIGYFHCFLGEMFCINFEEQWQKVWRKLGLSWMWDNPVLAFLMSIFCNFFIITSFAYYLVSFQFCTLGLFSKVYSSMYYCFHVWYLGWALLFPFVIKPLLGKEKKEKVTVEEKTK